MPGFYTSQVVQDFFHQQYGRYIWYQNSFYSRTCFTLEEPGNGIENQWKMCGSFVLFSNPAISMRTKNSCLHFFPQFFQRVVCLVGFDKAELADFDERKNWTWTVSWCFILWKKCCFHLDLLIDVLLGKVLFWRRHDIEMLKMCCLSLPLKPYRYTLPNGQLVSTDAYQAFRVR